jgi:hypothetical protein
MPDVNEKTPVERQLDTGSKTEITRQHNFNSNMPETGLRDKQLSAEARLWLLVVSVARSGVALGYSGQALWNGTLSFAHNMRGDLDLLTAHNVAIEAMRWAEAEART